MAISLLAIEKGHMNLRETDSDQARGNPAERWIVGKSSGPRYKTIYAATGTAGGKVVNGTVSTRTLGDFRHWENYCSVPVHAMGRDSERAKDSVSTTLGFEVGEYPSMGFGGEEGIFPKALRRQISS